MEFGEDLLELMSRQHALVDERARRERSKVHPSFMLGTPPQHER